MDATSAGFGKGKKVALVKRRVEVDGIGERERLCSSRKTTGVTRRFCRDKVGGSWVK